MPDMPRKNRSAEYVGEIPRAIYAADCDFGMFLLQYGRETITPRQRRIWLY